jgi:hypothetical protein
LGTFALWWITTWNRADGKFINALRIVTPLAGYIRTFQNVLIIGNCMSGIPMMTIMWCPKAGSAVDLETSIVTRTFENNSIGCDFADGGKSCWESCLNAELFCLENYKIVKCKK